MPFRFNRIVIIQSLEPEEANTGEIIFDYIRSSLINDHSSISIEYINCEHSENFIHTVDKLISEAENGNLPLLHIDSHGDDKDGLEFANGSMLSWGEISEKLIELNIATKFNLFTIFSSCFGAHFLSQMNVIRHAPCYGFIGPTLAIGPDEIIRGLFIFYENLIQSNNLAIAFHNLKKYNLTNGEWFCEAAENWYLSVIESYIENSCSESAINIRAKKIYRNLKYNNSMMSIGAIKRQIKHSNKHDLTEKFFNEFFIIDKIPDNANRFEKSKLDVYKLLDKYRSKGKFII